MKKAAMTSQPCNRHQCGSCEQWQGARRIVLGRECKIEVAANSQGGMCRNGEWRGFFTLPRQRCDQYQRWEALLDEPLAPVVLSAILQLHHEIRMRSHLAESLPEDMCEKIDELLWDIERWHIQRQLASSSKEEQARERFFNEFVSGVFDCFYYFGWSRRKPGAEILLEDIWPL